MKNAIMKKMILSLLCITMLISLMTGCGGQQAGPSNTTNTAASASGTTAGSTTEPTTADPLAEKVSLKIAMMQNSRIEDIETNWLTYHLEEQLNVDLSFELFPADKTEAATKFNLLVSSNSKLPDIVNIVLAQTVIDDYGDKGIFLDLTSYLNDPEKTPNFNKIPQADRDFMIACSLSPQSTINFFGDYQINKWNESAYRVWVLQEWLTEVGMKDPTTTDEFYAVLKAFVEQDPNKNNKKDEIGMVGSTGWAGNPIVFLMNSFLYANPSKNYFDLKDGKIITSFTQPEWKEGLEYISKLVSEGLVSPLSFTQDETQLRALVNVEKGMAGFVPAGSYSVFDIDMVGQTSEGTGYRLIAPVKGPSGNAWTPQNPTVVTPRMAITKDCANVDRAVLLADYFYDPEKFFMFQFGEPGVDLVMDSEDTKDYVLSNALTNAGYTVSAGIINNTWSMPVQNKTWVLIHPAYFVQQFGEGTAKTTTSFVHKDSEAAKKGGDPNTALIDYFDQYVPFFRSNDDLIVRLPYTQEEATALADIRTTINKYVTEQTVAFATGKRSLSDWDKYLAELEKMGLKQYIETNQAAYDRFGK